MALTELVKGRPWMRPALTDGPAHQRAPIWVFRHDLKPDWAWICRGDCWAWYPSGWNYPTWGDALADGLEHLRVWHRMAPCREPLLCTKSHVLCWPEGRIMDYFAGSYLGHRGEWMPLLPKQVTLRAA